MESTTKERLLTKDQFNQLRTAWKSGFHKYAGADDHTLWTIIRGADINKAFPPAHTEKRIRSYACQGQSPTWKKDEACLRAHSRIGNDLWNAEHAKTEEDRQQKLTAFGIQIDIDRESLINIRRTL